MADIFSDSFGGNYSNIPSGQQSNVQGGQQSNIVEQLKALINQSSNQAMTSVRPKIMLPGQLPPRQSTPVQPNMVNPNTIGGPARNDRVSLAASIAGLVNKAEDEHSMKKARDIAFDMERIQDAMSNPTPENENLVNEILSDKTRRKNISDSLNINFMGGEDKRKPFQKMGFDLWHRGKQQKEQQAQQQQKINYFQQLMKQMPQTLQLDPNAAQQAQLISMGLQPKADEIIKTLRSIASDQNKWDIATASIDQKERDSIRKAITSNDRTQELGAIARLNELGREKQEKMRAGATLGAATIKAGAEDRRTDVISQVARIKTDTQTQINANNEAVKAQKSLIDDATKIINSKEAKSSVKKDAKSVLDMANLKLKQLSEENQSLSNSLRKLPNANDSSTGTGSDTGQQGESDDKLLQNLINSFGNPEED